MKARRLTAFILRMSLRGRLLVVAAAGTLLLASGGSYQPPPRLLGFIVGSYGGALSALAVGMLLVGSGRFSEYCMSRMGCGRFTASIGVAVALAGLAASLAGLAAVAAYSLAGNVDARTVVAEMWAAAPMLVYTAVLMGYGYAMAAQLIQSSLPILVLLVLVTRLIRETGLAAALYVTPLAVAAAGLGIQLAVCSSPKLRAKLLRGASRRWRRALTLSRELHASYGRQRGVDNTTYP